MAKELDFDGAHGATYVDDIRKGIPGYEGLHAMTATLMHGAVPDGGRLLVVGCGGGEECLTLGGANPGWRISGVDPSAQMIAIARRRTDGRANVDLTHGHLADLPTDEPFDGATSLLVLHFIRGDEGKREHLREIARRLKSGAPLILAAVFRPDPSPLNDAVEKARGAFAVLQGADREKVAAKMEAIARDVDPVDEATTLRLLKEAGFPDAQRFYQGLHFAAWLAVKK